MRVLFICGTQPPKFCGIGDYTYKLINALKEAGLNDIHIIANINWSVIYLRRIIKEIKKIAPDIIHIQYPSEGYGYSIVPQILSLKFKTITTIHEVSHAGILRKLSLVPFSFRSTVILTTSFEVPHFKRLCPWMKKEIEIIPIGSNITKSSSNSIKRNISPIINFGQIRTQKGIEDVIDLAQKLKDNALPFSIIIAGQVRDGYKKYYKNLYEGTTNLPIQWLTDLSEEEVTDLLNKNIIAYLPFPDGASARRGSLIAALMNNMLVYTTNGVQTDKSLTNAVEIVSTPEDFIKVLAKNKREDFISLLEHKKNYISTYLNNGVNWEDIAEKHNIFYKSYLIK